MAHSTSFFTSYKCLLEHYDEYNIRNVIFLHRNTSTAKRKGFSAVFKTSKM